MQLPTTEETNFHNQFSFNMWYIAINNQLIGCLIFMKHIIYILVVHLASSNNREKLPQNVAV